jgi:pimeloyl-ACP methyl ester carboxylesterase
VDVDGARIHYVERGAGPQTLLLIHGLGGHARNFTFALVDRLADDFRVVVMERPGSGHSTRPRGAEAGPRAQARTVAAFVRALGLAARSWWGTRSAARSRWPRARPPDAVGGLALVAPLTHPTGAPPPAFARLALGSPLARALVAWTLATPAAILRRHAVLDAIFGPEPGARRLRDHRAAGCWASGRARSSPRHRPRGHPGRPAGRWSARYHTLRLPVGVLFGTGDRILDPRAHGEALRALVPDLRLELVEGGHMLPLTAPDRVAAFVREVARAVRERGDGA